MQSSNLSLPRELPSGPRAPQTQQTSHSTSDHLKTSRSTSMHQLQGPPYTKPPTPPATPPAATTPQMALSLAPVRESADFPPYLLPSEKAMGGTSITLYIFRVSSTGDLCLSLVKPLRVTVTELDVVLALYYVRVGVDDSLVVLRGGKPVARLERRMLEMFGGGYHQFGFVSPWIELVAQRMTLTYA